MKRRQLIECTIDPSNPIPELSAVISAVLEYHPDEQADILYLLYREIECALTQLESEGTEA